jgi:hypothetical protein
MAGEPPMESPKSPEPSANRTEGAPVPLPISRPLLVGSLPAYKGTGIAGSQAGLDLTRLTHLNPAFGTPPKYNDVCTIQSDMSFSLTGQTDADVDAIVTTAHAAGIKVLPSVGGGGGDQQIIQFSTRQDSLSL